MRDLYGDDYESVAVGDAVLIPSGVRRLAGAAVFLALVAGLGLWSYRLGTRDAAEVPVIRAMEGPARVEPDDPGGIRAAHQGLEVNDVLAGKPAQVARPRRAGKAVAPAALVARTAHRASSCSRRRRRWPSGSSPSRASSRCRCRRPPWMPRARRSGMRRRRRMPTRQAPAADARPSPGRGR